MIEERKALIKAILKDGDHEPTTNNKYMVITEYQRLSGKPLDFLDILLLTRVLFLAIVFQVKYPCRYLEVENSFLF